MSSLQKMTRKIVFKPKNKLRKLNLDTDSLPSLNYTSSNSNYSSKTPSPIGTCIIPNKLYLSDYCTASNKNFLQTNNITAIISLYFQPLPQQIVSSLKSYCHIPIDDNCSVNIHEHFQKCINFIENNEIVLVHCQAGISRSPTIVMAYLMNKMTLGWQEAYKYVQERRTIAAPNFSFISQLFRFEKEKINVKFEKLDEKWRNVKFDEKFDKIKNEKWRNVKFDEKFDKIKNS